MGRRLAVHASALALICSTAVAAPRTRPARAAFEQGVAAYKKSDYTGASAAFEKSFAAEADVETMFAWAQAERKLGNCDKASELYNRLLGMKMPTANRAAVKDQLEQCKKELADEKLAEQTRADARAKADAQANADKAAADAKPVEPEPAPQIGITVAPDPQPVEAKSSWYGDPLGDVLAGGGLVVLGVGIGLYVSGSNLNDEANGAPTVGQYNSQRDSAESRVKLGEIVGGIGAACLLGGILRYATRSDQTTTIATFGDSHTAGLAILGSF